MSPPLPPVDPRRRLPSVQRLLDTRAGRRLVGARGHAVTVDAIRKALAVARHGLAVGEGAPTEAELLDIAFGYTEHFRTAGPRPVINATGIVLHTNLGRAPLAAEAIARMAEVAAGYCDLEFDLESGGRGSRTASIEPLLRDLTGAGAALAVNNGAAAILLALAGSAGGGEVVVSRGELVEIGGGFRIPDVILQGGARLVEVGSTNKTRLEDYRAAIGPATRVLLKVHQSNFRMQGFTAEVGLAEVAALGRDTGLLTVADLGSGLLAASPNSAEPSIRQALAAGVDLVTCSGDKLLGGPQAGLILGSQAAVDPLRRHPLLRALRLDKVTLAALATTLELHRDDPARVPVMALLRQSGETLQRRAEHLLALVSTGSIEPSFGHAGGGALPGDNVASRVLAIAPAHGAEALAARLRLGSPPVVGRIHDGRLLIDMLTVSDAEVDELAKAVRSALA